MKKLLTIMAMTGLLMANTGKEITLVPDENISVGNIITNKNVINIYKVKNFKNVTARNLKIALSNSICNNKNTRNAVEFLKMPILFIYVSDRKSMIIEINSCK